MTNTSFYKSLVVALLMVAVNTGGAFAVPPTINFQGELTDANGPVNGNLNMTFEFYTGNALPVVPVWSETRLVSVTNGVYMVQLGSVAAFPKDLFQQERLYLSVILEGKAILSLQPITTVPYAFRAASADEAATVGGLAPDEFMPVGTDSWVDEAGDTMTGPLSVGAEVESTSGGFRFPDGTVQTTAANNLAGSLDNLAELLGEPEFAKFFPTGTGSLYPCDPKAIPEMRFFADGLPVGNASGFMGSDRISGKFYYLVAVQTNSPELKTEGYIGSPGGLTVTYGTSFSAFRGIITSFALAGWDGTNATYIARLEPFLSLLDLGSDYEIFQNKTIPQIITAVFNDASMPNYSMNLMGSYGMEAFETRYAETPADFVRRLMEREGIYHYFSHLVSGGAMVIGDHNGAFTASGLTLEYAGGPWDATPEPRAGTLTKRSSLFTGASTFRGYDFQRPALLVEGSSSSGAGYGEHYEYDSRITTTDMASHRAGIEQARHVLTRTIYNGTSNAMGLHAGHIFNIADISGAGLGGAFVVDEIRHMGLLAEDGTCVLANAFSAFPSGTTYRPERRTPVPRALGLISARVTGPAGQTYHTDAYGRIKVQFIWDRLGQWDDRSSAWIRVILPPGKIERKIFEPREFTPPVGSEVLVGFIQGDPSNPVVLGSVHNASWMPQINPLTPIADVRVTNTGGTISITPSDVSITSGRDVFIDNGRHLTITPDGSLYLSAGSATVNVTGNASFTTGGSSSTSVGNTATETIGGSSTTTVGGAMTYQSTGNASLKSLQGNLDVSGAQALTVTSGTTADIAAGGNTSFTTGGILDISALSAISVWAGTNTSLPPASRTLSLHSTGNGSLKSATDLLIEGAVRATVTSPVATDIRGGVVNLN